MEADPESTFLARWWRFSTTYLRLVAIGMAFAFAAAGIAEAFLVPGVGIGQVPAVRARSRLRRILTGLGMGPMVNLCSACVVPVSSAVRRGGLGVEGALALVHGSAVLNVPSLLMIAVIFSPSIGASRLLLGAAAAFLLGPLVAAVVGRRRGGRRVRSGSAVRARPRRDLATGAGRGAAGLGARLRPHGAADVADHGWAGLVSGAAIQFLRPETVEAFLGDNLTGILVAATLGVLINVPLLFEIPLVTVLLLLGAGTAPASALLFAAAAGGPVTFLGLSKAIPWRGIGAYAAGTWAIAAAGGLLVLAAGALLPERPALRLHAAESGEGVAAAPAAGSAVPARFPALRFADVSIESGVSGDTYHSRSAHSLGVNWIDVDRDGRPDLFAVGGDPEFPPRLFRNLGDGTFEAAHHLIPELPEYEMSGSVFADYDNDGDADIYVYTDRQQWYLHGSNAPDGPPNLLLKNLLAEHGGRVPAGRPLFRGSGRCGRRGRPRGRAVRGAAGVPYQGGGVAGLRP